MHTCTGRQVPTWCTYHRRFHADIHTKELVIVLPHNRNSSEKLCLYFWHPLLRASGQDHCAGDGQGRAEERALGNQPPRYNAHMSQPPPFALSPLSPRPALPTGSKATDLQPKHRTADPKAHRSNSTSDTPGTISGTVAHR